MKLSPEAIAAQTRRETEIAELNALWTKLCKLRGERVSFTKFDEEIKKRFQTIEGRDSLGFESIAKTKKKLEFSISEENKIKEQK